MYCWWSVGEWDVVDGCYGVVGWEWLMNGAWCCEVGWVVGGVVGVV